MELFNLIYLHSSAPSESVVEQLRASINRLKIFDDADDCLASLNNIENRKLILIVSERFARSFLPRLESLRTLVSIYILNEEDSIGHWTENHKVRGVFSAVDEIAALISEEIGILQLDVLDIQEVYHNRDSIRLPFLYRYFLAEILHDRRGTDNAFDELIHFVRNEYRGNREELENIELFRTTYRKDQAINWFLKRCFLSKVSDLFFFLFSSFDIFGLDSLAWLVADGCESSVSSAVVSSRSARPSRTSFGQRIGDDLRR